MASSNLARCKIKLHHGVSCSFCSAKYSDGGGRLGQIDCRIKKNILIIWNTTRRIHSANMLYHMTFPNILHKSNQNLRITGSLLRQFHRFETMFLNAMICHSSWVSHKETFTAFTTLTKQIYGDIDLIMTVAQSERARYNSLLWKSSFVAQYCRCNQHFLSFDKFTKKSRNASLPLPHLALFNHYCSRFAGSSSLLL